MLCPAGQWLDRLPDVIPRTAITSGRAFRTPNFRDEHSWECLAIRVKRQLNPTEILGVPTDLFLLRRIACQYQLRHPRIHS